MNPIKAFIPIAKWLLRISIALLVYLKFSETTLSFEFKGLEYFIPFSIVVVTLLLLIGGVLKGSTLTMISGFLLFVGVLLNLILISGISIDHVMNIFPLSSLSFYFFVSGNAS